MSDQLDFACHGKEATISATDPSSNSAPLVNSSARSGVRLPANVTVSFRAGFVLALANIVCILIFSWAWVHVKADPKTITVTGSAKKAITSDLIVWTAHISTSDPKLETAYQALKDSLDKAVAYLKAQGIADSEITVGSIDTHKHFERDSNRNETDKISSYELNQSVEVTSADVNKIADTARTITGLIKEGVLLESDSPRYLYTHMSDLKITMLAEATKDATIRARQIADNSGASLGSILDAKMGVMQINALHSDDVSGSGVNDTSTREKEITAVVSAKFGLR